MAMMNANTGSTYRKPVQVQAQPGQPQSSIVTDLEHLPQNKAAEEAVLGAILIDADVMAQVAPILVLPEEATGTSTGTGTGKRPNPEEVFFYDRHRAIYGVMYSLYRQEKPIDTLTVYDELSRTGRLDEAGGASYLIALANKVPTTQNAPDYAGMIVRCWLNRSLVSAAGKIAELGYTEDEAALEQAQLLLSRLSLRRSLGSIKSMADAMPVAWNTLAEAYDKPQKQLGLKCGLRDLDDMTGGFRKQDMIILAARPSVGKSACALTMAYNMAKAGHAVGFFSLEMSLEQLLYRLLAMESGVDLKKIRNCTFNDEEYEKLSEAFGALSELPIYIDDTDGLTVMEIREKTKLMIAQYGVEIIMVDYLGRIGGEAKDDYKRVSQSSRELKLLARNLDLPVLVLAQLNRAIEHRKGEERKPVLSDLRDSGQVEQDADVAIFLDREEMYDPETPRKGEADMIVAKQRNGEIGTIPLLYHKRTTRFMNLTGGAR